MTKLQSDGQCEINEAFSRMFFPRISLYIRQSRAKRQPSAENVTILCDDYLTKRGPCQSVNVALLYLLLSKTRPTSKRASVPSITQQNAPHFKMLM